MYLVVVHNPNAGGGDWPDDRVARVLRDCGHTVRMVSRKTEDWRNKLTADQPDAVVAAGGDGTVHAVLHALETRDVPIAIMPLGTANNVAHAFGYTAGDDLAERIAQWPQSERSFHLARVETNAVRHTFVESVGIGAFADMVRNPGGGKKKVPPIALLATRRRLVEMLLEAQPRSVAVRIDGRRVMGDYLLLECLNLPCFGPRLRMAPQQSPESRVITLCGVTSNDREAAAHWISTGVGDPTRFVIGHAEAVDIETDEPAHVDGERWPPEGSHGGRLRIEAAARCVRMWV